MTASQPHPGTASGDGRPTPDRSGGGGEAAGPRLDNSSAARPAPMATDEEGGGPAHAAAVPRSLADLAGLPLGGGRGGEADATALRGPPGGGPGVTALCASTSSPSASALSFPPAIDPAWASLGDPDAVVVLALDGEEEGGKDAVEPAPLVSVTARRARLGWEVARPAPARPLPPGVPPGRVALYGGGGDPIEGDSLYSCEASGVVRVRVHEARLRAASRRFAADMDRTGTPALHLPVPRGRTRAALTLLRALYENAALPPAADSGAQLLLLDVLGLARGWGVGGVIDACVARFGAAPPGRLAWPVAARLAGFCGGSGGAHPPAAASSSSSPPSRALAPDAVPLYTVLQAQVMAAAAAVADAETEGGEEEGEEGPAASPSGHHPRPHAPLLLPVGLDVDFVLDAPPLRAAWVDLPPGAVVRLLDDARCAAGCENSAIAAAGLWLAGGLEGENGGGAALPASRAAWAPVLATCLRPERATPLYAAALPTFAPWALGTGGGCGRCPASPSPSSSSSWAAAAAPRAARPVRPPSAVGLLDMEYTADAAGVAGLVSGGEGAMIPALHPSSRPPPPPPPSGPRFFRGLFWHLSVEPCQSDATKAGLFLHASYPPAAPGLAAAVNTGRAAAAALARSPATAGLLPPPAARPPAGAAWVITQKPASSAVAPLRLAMASVWPATTSYGLAGIRGMSGDAGSAAAWVKGGRLRFAVSVSEVL